ncbi:MAG: DNA mismatch repair endonuclease MutL [Oscillospiraceae bacterium]|nr:DNA mismatch repair endonuclease MutL [Bacillota bacterium]
MPKIVQLSRHVADLIAAGEVVERPASVVKELVENAIDAGAARITIEIQNGGMTFIRISDNGCGMAPEDARTAFLRHATSKIRNKDDLAAISTLGFRGEALAAISAVSRIDLLTKAADTPGVSLHLEAGQITQESPAGCPEGTTILVRDLFYNTPARMKFMKSDQAEASAVFLAVQQQALAHPEIAFRFLKDGQEQLSTAGSGDRMAAIYTVFGREIANNMIEVKGSWEQFTVRGFVTKPTCTRGNRSYQYFFVNSRFIKSRMLSAALEEAYKNQLMVGRFPVCVLEIDLPVQAVDVNVHPAKTEVKFLSERGAFDAVHYAVLSALNKAPGRPAVQLPKSRQDQIAGSVSSNIPASKKDFFQTKTAEEFRRTASAAEENPFEKPVRPAAKPVSVFVDEPSFLSAALSSPVQVPERTVKAPEAAPVIPKAEPVAPAPKEAPAPLTPVPEEEHFPLGRKAASAPTKLTPAPEPESQQVLSIPEVPFRVIGETMDTYILVEQGESLLLIDKHAAHERVLFEKLKSEEHPVMPQLLLQPVPVQLTKPEAQAVLENLPLLQSLGFDVSEFADLQLVLRQIPSDLTEEDACATLEAFAEDLLTGKRPSQADLRDNLLHTMACKAAIKAGWHTQPTEREALVREVLSRDDIKYCPHGRPVCIELTKKELEKQFKRT